MAQVEERQDVQNEILLTPEDIAKVFNVDVGTVEYWVDSELLSAIFVTPRNDMRFSVDSICRFVNEHEPIWMPSFKLDN
jgi:hypothetical protein